MLFSVRLSLLVIAYYILLSLANGQQVGVSLQLLGKTIPNNSLVNLDDLTYQTLYRESPEFAQAPTNANGLQTLMCVTDLVDCCLNEELGDWHLSNDSFGPIDIDSTADFRINRGQNEIINGQQYYGSVRLWRFYTPSQRGLFQCEIPDTDHNIHNFSVYILFFHRNMTEDGIYSSVAISTSAGSSIAGETYSLTCSATLVSDSNPPLPDYDIIPLPTFEWWFFGSNGSDPLLIPTETVLNSGIFTSTLRFSPLISLSHSGNYTCRLGAGSLVNSAMITVNAPNMSVQITASGAPMLGQNGYSLSCTVSGAEKLNSSIIYQWTKNNGTEIQIQVGGDPKVLSFFPLRLSDAGAYTCQAIVRSSYLDTNITILNSQDVILQTMSANIQNIRIQTPTPSSLMLTSNHGNTDLVTVGSSNITLTCTLVLNSALVVSDLSLLLVDAQLFMDGTPLTIYSRTMTDTAFTYTIRINSFRKSDSGNYTCTATVRPQPTSTHLTGNEMLSSNTVTIKAASAPPVDVVATQSLSSSAPVEVSWSPPTDEVAAITRYRIYYGNGRSILVPSVSVITSVSLKVDGNYIGQNVSIRSEADQLYSEIFNVSIVKDAAMCSCTSEIGIAVGAVFVVACLIITVTIVVVMMCLWRRKLSTTDNKNNFKVSANMAYDKVNLKPRETEEKYYENINPESILKPSAAGEWTEATATDTNEATDTSNPTAPEYANAGEAVRVTHSSM